MFQFLEFLRVVAIGTITLGLFGLIFCKSLFTCPVGILFAAAAVLGLLLQPFLRAYHPYRAQVKAVIAHVESYVSEVLRGLPRESGEKKLENALARAIYEYLYRTVEYSPFFTARVNEQIRFFYFYYFVGIALRVAAPCAIAASGFLWIAKGTGLGESKLVTRLVEELLLGIGNPAVAVPVVVVIGGLAIIGSTRFLRTARGIILTELYTRHVMLAAEQEKIRELASIAGTDVVLRELFSERLDKELGQWQESDPPDTH